MLQNYCKLILKIPVTAQVAFFHIVTKLLSWQWMKLNILSLYLNICFLVKDNIFTVDFTIATTLTSKLSVQDSASPGMGDSVAIAREINQVSFK